MISLVAALALSAAPAPASPKPAPVSPVAPVKKPDTQILRDIAETRNFTNGSPAGALPTPDGKSVLFLRSGPRDVVGRLYEMVVATQQVTELITPEAILGGGQEQLSDAEKARRERMRVSTRGFTSFKLSKDGKHVLLSLSGKLHLLDRASKKAVTLPTGDAPVIDPRLSPDASQVAYVKGADLYVLEIRGGKEHAVTRGGTDEVTHGLAEFVAQEEMGRFNGYWWSPDGKSLAYEEADHHGMEKFAIADPGHPERGATPFFYPRPGKANAKVRLGIVPVGGGKTTWVKWDAEKYPYLGRVVWEEEKAPLSILVQTRDQREEAFLSVDVRSGATSVLHVEKDDAWLNLYPRLPAWLPDGSGYLFPSDRSGRTELELHGRKGEFVRVVIPGASGFTGLAHIGRNSKDVLALCSPTPIVSQLVHVSIAGGEPAPLTHDDGEHTATFSEDGSIYVDSHYDLRTPRRDDVFRSDGALVTTLPSVAEQPPYDTRISLTTVEGQRRYYASVVRPREFDANKRYPVIVAVYGGPHVTVVHPSARHIVDQWIADHGAIVVAIDNRGTPRRDREWERSIKGSFGTIPLEDQIEALKLLGDRYHELDLDRVGIYGASFGGYMAALAVLKRPDVFKAAVAQSSVTEWRDYDTHYTERYLGMPDANAKGYDESSLLPLAPGLSRPLLLVHGTNDDNVYFFHSLKLADALFRAGKPFEFLPLQGFTHMVPEPVAQERLYTRVVDFLLEHL